MSRLDGDPTGFKNPRLRLLAYPTRFLSFFRLLVCGFSKFFALSRAILSSYDYISSLQVLFLVLSIPFIILLSIGIFYIWRMFLRL
jgi:hypothetical protein